MIVRFLELNQNKELARQLFEKADNDFKRYLGYEDGVESAIEEVTEPDNMHKYWAIYNGKKLIGLIYIYDYKEKYHKCSLGYGLLSDYRGKKLTPVVINQFCDYLENSMNIIRIQADIETTNTYCLNSIESVLSDISFKYECTADNYWGQNITCKIYSRCIE